MSKNVQLPKKLKPIKRFHFITSQVEIHICMCVYTYISEKAMAPHSSTLAWKIPWTEKPGRLQSIGSQRIGHD